MGKYLGGYKTYKVSDFKQLNRVLGEIAKETARQIEEEAVQIAKDTIEEVVYSRPTSDSYERTQDLLNTPFIYNKWKNAYGQGFSLAYDTTRLSASPKITLKTDDGWKTMLGQHMGVGKQNVKDYVMTWINEGFPIIGSGREYEATHFKEITEQRIRQRIQEIINSYK